MMLSELIKEVTKAFPQELDVEITFDVGLMNDGRTINEMSKNRVKFSITNRRQK